MARTVEEIVEDLREALSSDEVVSLRARVAVLEREVEALRKELQEYRGRGGQCEVDSEHDTIATVVSENTRKYRESLSPFWIKGLE